MEIWMGYFPEGQLLSFRVVFCINGNPGIQLWGGSCSCRDLRTLRI
jgi:hypothetical protein